MATANNELKSKRRAKVSKNDKELREAFSMFDEDRSGCIDAKELRQILFLFGCCPTEQDVNAMIKGLDKNDNGKIDFEEFKTLMSEHWQEPEEVRDELLEAFRMFDRDGSGFIEKNELVHILRQGGELLSKEEIDDIFNSIDKNGDGRIDYNEFAAAMCQNALPGK